MALKVSDILTPMVNAAKDSFSEDWPKIKDYAKPELKKLAESLVTISKLIAVGKVNKQQGDPPWEPCTSLCERILSA